MDDFYIYLAIVIYLGILIYIGKRNYNKDAGVDEFILDNRGLGPVLTALSAGASDMSGWMILGLPGVLYATGLCNVWIAIGLSVGAWANYKILAKRLRVYTEVAGDSSTIPDFFENRFRDNTKTIRFISGIIILVFYTLYVSSGIIAGGKTFESFFGINFAFGAIFTLFVVVVYTFFGGFKAVCETDAFQGVLMFAILVLIPSVAYFNINIPDGSSFVGEIKKYSSDMGLNHLNIFEGQSFLGIIGLLAWGLGYFGQPHIIVRFMAIRSIDELTKARFVGISWMVIGLIGAIASGLIGFVYFSSNGVILQDSETVFLQLGSTLFHPFIVGVIISAVLAAVMSTISSQLLVCSSSATQDFLFQFYKKDLSDKAKTFISRLAVVFIGVVATFIAFMLDDTVLKVVGYAWAGFGASFGPALLFSLYSSKTTTISALSGMIVGGATVILWIAFGFSQYIYELFPGFICSILAIIIVNYFNSMHDKETKKAEKILNEFDEFKEQI
ncbi:sodium/proline symporter PutP [Campylobacter sp. RM12327]|uniref:sodium/proline symporter PutP n=1 Tax=Campylobacter sputorum TaxID=206 RepID=UPI000B792DF8|nr:MULTISPECIES: sodium/proline symporter PutP [Campylobacter]ASM39853.1 Na+/proline symporter [Campylobacter sputorum]MBE7357503.1 sodium/proline symporter PutP [Campylobacter sp. RM11302]MBF6669197.1 sodium/proline symporter PutP [Campylobacter sp. RM12327]MBF6674328.1 sodium/proline symporter PutP [Campylobacter sp. RM13538]MBF6675369.1 sodium/proline symporter PutP [Campylobacter sp. RM12321]